MSYVLGKEDFFVFMVKYWPAFLTAGPAPFAFIARYSFLFYAHILYVFNRVALSNVLRPCKALNCKRFS